MSEANVYASKPWLARYTPGLPHQIEAAHRDALSLFRAAVARAADKPALIYFDGVVTYAELDRMSDALAAALLVRGFSAGDRCAVYMQNMPQFPIVLLGAWKAGGIAVPINPMNRERELTLMLTCAPKAFCVISTNFVRRSDRRAGQCPRPDIITSTSALRSSDPQRSPRACAWHDARALRICSKPSPRITWVDFALTPNRRHPAFIVTSARQPGLPGGDGSRTPMSPSTRAIANWWYSAEGRRFHSWPRATVSSLADRPLS
ncbi:MAG: AMP-binding protein [Methylobacteriaceae bacterium]|nr:AMP-binding protein [Methylobacteriaceae bacterium]